MLSARITCCNNLGNLSTKSIFGYFPESFNTISFALNQSSSIGWFPTHAQLCSFPNAPFKFKLLKAAFPVESA